MKFIKAPIEQAIPDIANHLIQPLKNSKKVLWLVCGGSNIDPQVKVMNALRDSLSDDELSNLTILPMDERYGLRDHADSNFRQMREAGFKAGPANYKDVLEKGLILGETVSYYAELVESAFADANFVLGTFGMGADGHTAGVLPNSAAVNDVAATVVGYQAPGYIRLTLTPPWLVKCDVSFLMAYGEAKNEALNNLQKNQKCLEDMPAKLHYDIATATVYNDQVE